MVGRVPMSLGVALLLIHVLFAESVPQKDEASGRIKREIHGDGTHNRRGIITDSLRSFNTRVGAFLSPVSNAPAQHPPASRRFNSGARERAKMPLPRFTGVPTTTGQKKQRDSLDPAANPRVVRGVPKRSHGLLGNRAQKPWTPSPCDPGGCWKRSPSANGPDRLPRKGKMALPHFGGFPSNPVQKNRRDTLDSARGHPLQKLGLHRANQLPRQHGTGQQTRDSLPERQFPVPESPDTILTQKQGHLRGAAMNSPSFSAERLAKRHGLKLNTPPTRGQMGQPLNRLAMIPNSPERGLLDGGRDRRKDLSVVPLGDPMDLKPPTIVCKPVCLRKICRYSCSYKA